MRLLRRRRRLARRRCRPTCHVTLAASPRDAPVRRDADATPTSTAGSERAVLRRRRADRPERVSVRPRTFTADRPPARTRSRPGRVRQPRRADRSRQLTVGRRGVGQQAPTVSQARPRRGIAGVTTLQATAGDADGSVSKVGSTTVDAGRTTTCAYDATISRQTAPFTIIARAVDDQARTTSARQHLVPSTTTM